MIDNDIKLEKGLIESLKNGFKLFFERHFLEKEFWNNKIILWLLSLNLIANIVNWVVIAIFINHLDGDIILHYNVYFGVDNMGNWEQAFILPTIGMIIFILDAILATYFFIRKERIASHILLLASLMAQLCLIVAAASLIMINY